MSFFAPTPLASATELDMRCCVWECMSQRPLMPSPMVLGLLRSLHFQSACPVSSQESTVLVLWCGCYVAKLCPTLRDTMDYSPPGSSVHGIPQARILEWVAISFSRASSQLRGQTQVSCITGRFFTTKPPGKHRGGMLLFFLLVICLVLWKGRVKIVFPPIHMQWSITCQ